MYKMKILICLLCIMNAQAMEIKKDNDRDVSLQAFFLNTVVITMLIPQYFELKYEPPAKECSVDIAVSHVNDALERLRVVQTLSVLNKAYADVLNDIEVKKEKDLFLSKIKNSFSVGYYEYINQNLAEQKLGINDGLSFSWKSICFFIGTCIPEPIGVDLSNDYIFRNNGRELFRKILFMYSFLQRAEQKENINIAFGSLVDGIFARGITQLSFKMMGGDYSGLMLDTLPDNCVKVAKQHGITLEYYKKGSDTIFVNMFTKKAKIENTVGPISCCTIL